MVGVPRGLTRWLPVAAVACVGFAPVPAAADAGHDFDVRQIRSFDGLNHFIDRPLAQASVEPPELGLCAGNGYVVESVASAIVVYDTQGDVVQAPMSLNSFYQYPPVIGPSGFGPRLNDPSCYFDVATQRWFHTVLTVEVMPTGPVAGAPTAVNHVDIAVSQTADPTGAWSFYKLYARHDCPTQQTPPWVADAHVCVGDFPRIGADAHGFYVTTNDYSYFSEVFRSASVYAFSKQQLETNTGAAAVTRFDTAGMVAGAQAGFTVSPAQSFDTETLRSGDLDTARGGTEFFLSSNAADEVNATKSGKSHELVLWTLTNTESLDSEQPALQLTSTIVTVDQYAVPPRAQQKEGPVPLASCLNDTTIPTPFGIGCWTMLHLPAVPSHDWGEGQAIDTGDTRMQQVTFAGGVVYGALGTAVSRDEGVTQAGLEWFAVRPHVAARGAVHAQLVNQGYVARETTSLSAPALVVDGRGRGTIAFSLMGPNDYPSAAYVPFDVKHGAGDIHIAGAGVGPDDGYTNYAAAFGLHDPRARWGDYGAAVVDGSRIWMASEYVAQSCTFAEWLATGTTCGNTRAGAANWATRITEVSAGG